MALSQSTIASANAVLKEHYLAADKIKNVMVEAGPVLMELLERAELSAGGRQIPFPVITGSGGGIGSLYTAAYATTLPATSVVFELTRGTSFGVGQLGSEVLLASEDLDDAFIKDMVLELDAKRRRLLQYMAFIMYGDGTGTLAQVSSGQSVASTTLTLADAATTVRFNIGDVIQIAGSVGGANRPGGTAVTLTNGGATYTGCAYVVGVNLIGANAGTITVSATPGGAATALNTLWPAVAAGDFIYLAGDTANPANVGGAGNAIPAGFMAWIPLVAPIISDNFYSVNRFNNTFLFGQAIDATALGLNLGSIREALTLAVAQLHQVSARPSLIVMNPVAYYNLSLSLQSQGMYPGATGHGPEGEGNFGFSSLMLPTPHGDIRVVSDPMCAPFLNPATWSPANGYSGSMVAFILEEDTWEIVAVSDDGQIPFLEKRGTDGNALAQIPGQDVFWFSLKSYWAIGSHAPGHNALVALPAS